MNNYELPISIEFAIIDMDKSLEDKIEKLQDKMDCDIRKIWHRKAPLIIRVRNDFKYGIQKMSLVVNRLNK